MSSQNGKINKDPYSFDTMTKNVKPSTIKDPYKISDNKLIAWFQRYWYYYKAPAIICGIILLLVCFFVYDMVTKKEADMNFTIISEYGVSEEHLYELATHVTDYIVDANLDGTTHISPQTLILTENPKDDKEMVAYYQIMVMFSDANHVAFIVDEYAYDYMMNSNALEKLSHFGLESDEEYRLKLNDTIFMKDTALNEKGPYYLVFKICNADYVDDTVIRCKYDMFVELAEDIIGEESEDDSAVESNSDKLKRLAKEAVNAQ